MKPTCYMNLSLIWSKSYKCWGRGEIQAKMHCLWWKGGRKNCPLLEEGEKISSAQDPALIQSSDLLPLGKGQNCSETPPLKSRAAGPKTEAGVREMRNTPLNLNSSLPPGEVKKHGSDSFHSIGMMDLLKSEHGEEHWEKSFHNPDSH